MRSRSFCTLSNCRRAIVLVWCISLVLSLPAGYAQYIPKICLLSSDTPQRNLFMSRLV
ncbi:hypothetical protein E2C01_054088 [Portunus trituberculatus]|uniref:Uncharacterized protein n=1 Tax=Portunus trituberculatus TaxID=210409 RepID=A0A5B7GQZ8_PORTR|nr:hypothetical protein [Portunus trituberculatus]